MLCSTTATKQLKNKSIGSNVLPVSWNVHQDVEGLMKRHYDRHLCSASQTLTDIIYLDKWFLMSVRSNTWAANP